MTFSWHERAPPSSNGGSLTELYDCTNEESLCICHHWFVSLIRYGKDVQMHTLVTLFQVLVCSIYSLIFTEQGSYCKMTYLCKNLSLHLTRPLIFTKTPHMSAVSVAICAEMTSLGEAATRRTQVIAILKINIRYELSLQYDFLNNQCGHSL